MTDSTSANRSELDSKAEVIAPKSICLLRLSALGDVTHMLPVVNRLRTVWPQTRLTWVIGKFEHKLVSDLPGVEFVVFDKKKGMRAYRALRKQLSGERFDALLHMQVSLRANLLSSAISAKRRIGYDKQRSKDFHGLFINERIAAYRGEHVVNAFQRFLDTLGAPAAPMNWAVPISHEDQQWAKEQLAGKPTFIISACSSHVLRNWSADRYAAIADYVTARFGMQVVLCGGPDPVEIAMGQQITEHMSTKPLNLIGKDTVKKLLAQTLMNLLGGLKSRSRERWISSL